MTNQFTIPAGCKPLSKQEAYNAVRTMAEANPDNRELAGLLLYFAPKIPKAARTAEQWVAHAVGIKDVREYLNFLYSDGTHIYGCDGHRLAWAPTDKPAGYYCPKTFTPVSGMDGIKYPDVSRVIPKDTAEGATVNLNDCEGAMLGKVNALNVLGVHFNKAHMECVADGEGVVTFTSVPHWEQLPTGRESATTAAGTHPFGKWVVMPMRDKPEPKATEGGAQ